MLLQPWFEASIKRAYQHSGAGYAEDAYVEDDINRDAGWDREAYYSALETEYAQLRNQPSGHFDGPLHDLNIQNHAAETQRYADSLMRTRTTQDQVSAIQRNKRTRIMDKLPARNQNITTSRGVAGVLFLICLWPASVRAQVQPVPIYGGSPPPPLGGACQFAPSGPSGYLTPAGTIETCAIVPGRTLGFWQIANQPFQISLPQAAAVAMNGSDKFIFSANLPPLPPANAMTSLGLRAL